jgi:hypothetical protein
MMGAVEEGGKVASGFIAALGSQPVLLVQSLIIAGVVFILYAQGTRSFSEREALLKSVFDSQQNVREILSKCIVPPDRRSEMKLQGDDLEWVPLVNLPPITPLPIE